VIRRSLAALCAFAVLLAAPAAARAQFGITPGSFTVTAQNQDGSIAEAAATHPYSYTVSFALNTDAEGRTEGGEVRDILVDLPPGLIGNPQAVPRCPRQEFEGSAPHCSPSTQIGVVKVDIPALGQASGALYNVEPPPGVAAQLGFSAAGLNALQNATVNPDAGYAVHIATNSIPEEATAATVTVWGVPAESSHDAQRGLLAAQGIGPPVSTDAPRLPLLTLPATCGAPLETTIEVDSKLAPGKFVSASTESLDAGGNPSPLSGCALVPFNPQIFASPTAASAGTASGLGFDLSLPNQNLLNPSPLARVETEPVRTEVTLPAGLTVNPAAASGQDACSPAQFAAASADDPGCPAASKVGTLVARTPLLEEAIEGGVYLASPHQNPFGSLIALYIIARVPARGVVVKQAGEVRADPLTGQLTTSFDKLPPLPYSSFELNLREGPRAPLITPPTCGKYVVQAKLHPFSDPGTVTERTAPFTIATQAAGGPCVVSEGQLPNRPTMEAGTMSPIAGSYSPFIFKVSRQDGEQSFSQITATLPKGIVGKLAGIPYCSDAQIAAAAARNHDGDGALELASPSCPVASEVGSVDVAAGAGAQPLHVQGRAYLAGPYKGAPLSLAVITPAIAGPFDVGVVVVRTALFVNETTAQIRAVSDPLPTILAGIPLDVRSVSLQMSRPNFTLNPTNCNPMAVLGSAISTLGQTASFSNRFQVGACGALGFKPGLKLNLKGGTRRTQHPKLKAVVTYPKGSYANIAKASVILPRTEFIDPTRVANPCTRPQFSEGKCPKGSILGTAKAFSPLLDKPLTGKVYFRANGGERALPDMVVDLNGQVHFILVGYVDAVVKRGTDISRIRNTFANVPDAPVSKFVLELKGGKEGLLQNSDNLCTKPRSATVKMSAQNGLVHNFSSVIGTSCKKK
jgi:hypothetical protein